MTSRSVFKSVEVDGNTPKATLEDLAAETIYHVRVAPKFGTGVGRFSDPTDAFSTPTVPIVGNKGNAGAMKFGRESTLKKKRNL